MDDLAIPDRAAGEPEAGRALSADPAMPAVRADTLWRGGTPYLLTDSGRHSLGWQDSKKDGPVFVLVRISIMDTRKVLDRFPLTEDGWARAWAALVKLDPAAARAVAAELQARLAKVAEDERRSRMFEVFARAGQATVFQALGVQILPGDDMVYSVGFHNTAMRTNSSRPLGPLAGAEAMVTDGAQAWSPGRAMFLPIALAGLATKTQADAAVVFPDGTVHTIALDGNTAVRAAQKDVVQFNALAGVAARPETTPTDSDPATRLRQLQELRDADLLTQEEYEAKRTEIINTL